MTANLRCCFIAHCPQHTHTTLRYGRHTQHTPLQHYSIMADQPKPKAEGKKEKKKPDGLVIPPKKPKLTKAERRALQEQQRAAKAVGGGGKGKQQQQQQQSSPKPETPPQGEGGKEKEVKETSASTEAPPSKENSKTISLFSHLPPYQGECMLCGKTMRFTQFGI